MAPVVVVAYQDVSIFELAVPCEVFGVDRSDMGLPNYDFSVCAAEPPPIRVKGSLFTLDTAHGLEEVERAGTVIVPAWDPHGPKGLAALIEALQAAHARGARVVSVCSGAFLLAAAGLLDGRRATTHWMYASQLTRDYPRVKVDPKVLYVQDGNVFTSAGTAAGIDLCLHLVRLDYGAEIANMFARRMVVPPHRDGGQAQYVDLPLPASATADGLSDTLQYIQSHLQEPLTVEELARRQAMSPRTFVRRFAAVTGSTPHRWVLCQRLLRAQQVLETTDLPVELVADHCGLGSAATLRQLFHRQLSTSPQAYRRTFQGESAKEGSATPRR
ncbi:MAG TPA: helix-turn-helix domain-containing protein [Chloroflexota bacterium]|nr:helix-turn-helix domain-containing protein [Chloroflexota bacterium]